jgi:hypothetical protein
MLAFTFSQHCLWTVLFWDVMPYTLVKFHWVSYHFHLHEYKGACSSIGLRLFLNIRNKLFFYVEELLAPRPTLKLEDHSLSFVLGCLFSIFTVTLHLQNEVMPCSGDRDRGIDKIMYMLLWDLPTWATIDRCPLLCNGLLISFPW